MFVLKLITDSWNILSHRFTSKTRQQQFSGSEFPVEDVDKFVGESSTTPTASVADSNVRFLIGASDEYKEAAKADDINSIEEERQGEGEAKDLDELSSQKQKIKNFALQSVQFVEPVVHSADDSENVIASPIQPSINVVAKLDSDTHTVAQLPEYSLSYGGSGDLGLTPDELEPYIPLEPPVLNVSMPTNVVTGSRLSKIRSSLTGQSLSLNTALAATSFTPCSMPQSSACFTAPNPDGIPQAAARDLSSMFNPLIGEYTSITDAIDISCIGDRSPPCSPGAAAGIVFTVNDGYLETDVKAKERSAASSKQLELKQAEEMEHQRMETLIRHRLRQISQV